MKAYDDGGVDEPSSEVEEVLFEQAIGLPPSDRRTFLDVRCKNDPIMRSRVQVLIDAHEKKRQLESPIAVLSGERPGATIGGYTLLEEIGCGTYGTVWIAEQATPHRRVALKIIKLGMDTPQVVARFDAERQALALMQHQSIAQIHDGGSTIAGRPFFVMELVRGVPITTYCDTHHASLTARLRLIIQICDALQHAHGKGIIHRDIKPSNVLVAESDGVAIPKIIDFGIAKAIYAPLTGTMIHTEYHQAMGTRHYMSPEQSGMSGVDPDCRSDIYSVGVVLYELLVGKDDVVTNGLSNLQGAASKIARRPSIRFTSLQGDERTTVAARLGTDPCHLTKLLEDELDWIVMRATETDPTRRYASANEFAKDLTRFLERQPVLARPRSLGYLAARYVRKHKGTCLVVGCLLVFSAIAIRQASAGLRAEREQVRLRQEIEAAQRSRAGSVLEVASTFDHDAEGWSRYPLSNRGTTFRYNAGAGHPDGAIVIRDGQQGAPDFFMAPKAFLGDKTTFYGGALSFDLRLNGVGKMRLQTYDAAVRLESTTTQLIIQLPAPTVAWRSYRFALTESSGWKFAPLRGLHAQEINGKAPTRDEFMSVLRDLKRVNILADFRNPAGEELAFLDNVRMTPPASSGSPTPVTLAK